VSISADPGIWRPQSGVSALGSRKKGWNENAGMDIEGGHCRSGQRQSNVMLISNIVFCVHS